MKANLIWITFMLACTGKEESTDTDAPDTDTPDTDAELPNDSIEIAGDYVDNWDSDHNITEDSWIIDVDSSFTFTSVSNAVDGQPGWAIAQNAADNVYDPGLFSVFEWFVDNGLYYCQSTYDAADETTAFESPRADATDLEEGCGGFSWSQLKSENPISGDYEDNWGGEHLISAFTWINGYSEYHISTITETASGGKIVAQNSEYNDYNPEKWSVFDWAWSDNELYYCQSTYDAADEATAEAAEGADASDLSSGCGGFSWSQLRTPNPISGDWADNWGGAHSISAFVWENGSSNYRISSSQTDEDEDNGRIVAQNDANNDYNPGLWSVFDWTWSSDWELYYCQSTYNAADEAAAEAAESADASDLSSGCGGFSWSQLREQLTISGNWSDNWGGSHSITPFTWINGESTYHISYAETFYDMDSETGWAVAQNDSNNTYNPEMWSVFEWIWDSNGGLYYCQSTYDAIDEETADLSDGADTDDLESGCGGFSWSTLIAQ